MKGDTAGQCFVRYLVQFNCMIPAEKKGLATVASFGHESGGAAEQVILAIGAGIHEPFLFAISTLKSSHFFCHSAARVALAGSALAQAV